MSVETVECTTRIWQIGINTGIGPLCWTFSKYCVECSQKSRLLSRSKNASRLCRRRKLHHRLCLPHQPTSGILCSLRMQLRQVQHLDPRLSLRSQAKHLPMGTRTAVTLIIKTLGRRCLLYHPKLEVRAMDDLHLRYPNLRGGTCKTYRKGKQA